MGKDQDFSTVIKQDGDGETSHGSNQIFVSVKDDSTGSCGGVKLNGSNFRTWKKMMEAHLCVIDKVGYVDGSIAEPPIAANNYSKWKTANGSVTSILYKSMTEDVSQMIMGCNTAEEIWESLKEIYFNGTDFAEVYELNTQAARMTQDGKLVAMYLAKLKGIWQEIDQMRPCRMKCPDDVKIYKEEKDLMRVHVFLAGLDPIFENARSELLRQTTTPILQQAFAYIRKDETQRAGTRAVTSEVAGLVIQSKPSNPSRIGHSQAIGLLLLCVPLLKVLLPGSPQI
ncbi:uncharacterized protein LOC112184472 [Rosa chinensis]|uniref:uncharacterized protein LOC112184472 n=1 Tax=Rosa chinensis TaxID=74649 RepID=UPI000D0889E1|nr:uncharacterized protein LOC112184472 [Rosa chinensis]